MDRCPAIEIPRLGLGGREHGRARRRSPPAPGGCAWAQPRAPRSRSPMGLIAACCCPARLQPDAARRDRLGCRRRRFLALALGMAAQRRRNRCAGAPRWRTRRAGCFSALMAGAAFFSMFAILGLMHEAKTAGGHVMLELSVLAGATILLSWLFAHTVFAVHYAHEYFYDRRAKARRARLSRRSATTPTIGTFSISRLWSA